VIHYDVKPNNIIIDEQCILDPGARAVKLIDFGNVDPGRRLPAKGCQSAGTAFFVVLEVVAGERCLSPAVDVWALGITLYEMAMLQLSPGGAEHRGVRVSGH
jgi:serine/threonine protein kinase